MDVPEVRPTTLTNLHIRPYQWTDESGHTHVDFSFQVSVDNVITGRGSGPSLGAALVAAGLDMMGIEADLLSFTLNLVREEKAIKELSDATPRTT